MLRFAFPEELLRLAPDDESVPLAPAPKPVRSSARPGATLLDLTPENRIDTDRTRLIPPDAALVADDLPDAALQKSPPPLTPPMLTLPGLPIFLERPHRLSRPRHPAAHPPLPDARRRGAPETRLRIMGILFSVDIPTPSDAALIGLADACGIFAPIL